MTMAGTLEGFRAYMLQQHGIHADDEALEFALVRARSYSGSEAGVYTVASRWVIQAAEADERI